MVVAKHGQLGLSTYLHAIGHQAGHVHFYLALPQVQPPGGGQGGCSAGEWCSAGPPLPATRVTPALPAAAQGGLHTSKAGT